MLDGWRLVFVTTKPMCHVGMFVQNTKKKSANERAFYIGGRVITRRMLNCVRSPPMFPNRAMQSADKSCRHFSVSRSLTFIYEPSEARAAFLLIDYSFFRILISTSYAHTTDVIPIKRKTTE